MRYLFILPRYLLTLSVKARLSIVALSALAALLPMLIAHTASLGNLAIFPVTLAAWLFKKRGGFLFLLFLAPFLFTMNTVFMSGRVWPQPLIIGFTSGMLVYVVLVLLVAHLRSMLELTDAAQEQMKRSLDQQHQLNQLKDQFLLNVSHELRTPLTEIHGYLELLQDFRTQLDEPTQATFLSNAIRGCEELQRLIGNVLDTRQLEQHNQKPQVEPLMLADVINEVLLHFDPRKLQAHPVRLDVPSTIVVQASRQHLHQILRNLLSNAFKYSESCTPVIIQAQASEQNMIEVSIRDAGLGIPPAEIPLLFGRFVRLQRDLSGPIRGSGLGLYICKQLLEEQGGTIWIESSGIPGEGSCFSFRLPQGQLLAASQPSLVEARVVQGTPVP